MIVALDQNGDVILANRKACELLGYTEKQLLGQNWFTTCLPQTEVKQVSSVFKTVMMGNLDAVEYYENLVVTQSGQERMIAWHNSYLHDVDGNITGILIAGEDITARKAAEYAARQHQSELAHVARINTMGEMATGMAHELNQPLTAISTYASIAIRLIHSDKQDPDMLDESLNVRVQLIPLISHSRTSTGKLGNKA